MPPARRMAVGCVRCTCAWLPQRGNPWALKAFLRPGRTTQDNFPPPLQHVNLHSQHMAVAGTERSEQLEVVPHASGEGAEVCRIPQRRQGCMREHNKRTSQGTGKENRERHLLQPLRPLQIQRPCQTSHSDWLLFEPASVHVQSGGHEQLRAEHIRGIQNGLDLRVHGLGLDAVRRLLALATHCGLDPIEAAVTPFHPNRTLEDHPSCSTWDLRGRAKGHEEILQDRTIGSLSAPERHFPQKMSINQHCLFSSGDG